MNLDDSYSNVRICIAKLQSLTLMKLEEVSNCHLENTKFIDVLSLVVHEDAIVSCNLERYMNLKVLDFQKKHKESDNFLIPKSLKTYQLSRIDVCLIMSPEKKNSTWISQSFRKKRSTILRIWRLQFKDSLLINEINSKVIYRSFFKFNGNLSDLITSIRSLIQFLRASKW